MIHHSIHYRKTGLFIYDTLSRYHILSVVSAPVAVLPWDAVSYMATCCSEYPIDLDWQAQSLILLEAYTCTSWAL